MQDASFMETVVLTIKIREVPALQIIENLEIFLPLLKMATNLQWLGYEDEDGIKGGFDYLAIVVSFVGLSFGCAAAILFVGADAWRAFKQKKHWIPGDSLVLGALSLQLLMLLNKPSFDYSISDKVHDNPFQDVCMYLNEFYRNWTLILTGRVSTCVLMGCLLPGVARPLSTNLRTDMAAFFISFALVVLHTISYEISILPTAYQPSRPASYISGFYLDRNYVYRMCPNNLLNLSFVQLSNVIVLVSMMTLVLLLACAALASISIHEIVCRRIPVSLSALKFDPHLYPNKILWEKVEEQVVKSWIVVRTSNPQYVIARSILSSSVALLVTVCNAVLIFETARCSYQTIRKPADHKDPLCIIFGCYSSYNEGCLRPPISIPLILHYTVIVIGSGVIYCRCITGAVYYPRRIEWKLSSVRDYFQIEDFWVSPLLKLIDSSKRHRRGVIGESYLKKLVIKFFRIMRFHKLLSLILCLQICLVIFSKACCLLSQILFSNKIFAKLLVGLSCEELSILYGQRPSSNQIQLERDSEYDKYKRYCVRMRRENPAGLWIANRKSFQEIKKRFGKGKEEGARYNELIAFLVEKSSAGFRGQRCVNPVLPLGLEVESEFNLCKRSCKMTAVSILTLIFELSTFTDNGTEPQNLADRAIEACSQAWNMMDVVECYDSEAAVLVKAANQQFHKLQKERKWLDFHIPLSSSLDKSPEAARGAVEGLFEKGKEIANAYDSRAWDEIAAGYSLCRVCQAMINDYDFNNVQGIVDGLQGVLAAVIGSCIAKAPQVMAEDCKKWATHFEEERIWKAAKIAGKVKAVMEKVGWTLEWSSQWNIGQSANGDESHYFIKHATFPTID